MVSIRKRLLVSIFSILILFTFAVSIVIFIEAKNEIEEVYDENMKQVALAISGNENWNNESKENSRDDIDGEEEFLIQVWKDGILQYTSHKKIELPLQAEMKYTYMSNNDYDWRVYRHNSNNRQIQIAQPIEARKEIVTEIVYQFLVPLLTLIPIMFVLVFFFIGKGLKPLFSISEKVGSRNENNLSLIEEQNVPKEVFPLVQSLNKLLARLEDAFHKQRRFTADAAHELRTPLTAVKLQLDILERADSKKETKSATLALKAGVDRSINLVKSLLMLARNEPEGLNNFQDEVNLNSVVEDVMKNLQPIAKEKNVNLKFNLVTNIAIIKGQKEAFVTLVENLVQNAILYSNENGCVEIDVFKDNKNIVLKVSDNGIGISESEKARVFDRFYRVLGTKKSGSGLGLSIVKNIVDYYNGTIQIENGINGQGCSFIVKFPS